MGVSLSSLEQNMSHSEYLEWEEYFSTVPSIQEVQMAQLLYVQNAKAGVKNLKVEDFMLTKTSTHTNTVDLSDVTASQLNEVLGV